MQIRLSKILKPTIYLLVLFFIIILVSRSTEANPDTCKFHNISGWAWSSNIGWVSLSCWNTGEGQAGPNYGLDIRGNEISGWAWSTNVGWICFGTKCSGTAPDGSAPVVSYDSGTGAVKGWGKVVALGDDGWLKMRKAVGDGGANYGVTLESDLTLTGFAWNGNTTPGAGIGWLEFNSRVAGVLPECNDGVDNDSDNECDYTGCTIGETWYPADKCCYSENDPSEFCLGGGFWVETLYKDIYAKEEISSLFVPSQGKFNATYMILADNSISNWYSKGWLEQSGTLPSDWEKESVPGGEILFPEETVGVYKNVLGEIDYVGLITKVNGNQNKYGDIVRSDQGDVKNLAKNGELENAVYYSDGPLNFPPAQYEGEQVDFVNNSGYGIVVVDGDLRINATTTYTSDFVTDIRELASVTWIIRGDLIIDEDVGAVVGDFIVLGDGTPATCPALTQPSNGCGRVSTGTYSGSLPEERLIVQGLIIARQFKFEREYIDADGNPGEQVIFDGRLFANPSKAMRDLISSLPVWQEVEP